MTFLGVLAGGAGPGAAAAGRPGAQAPGPAKPPCVACLVLSLSPDQAAALPPDLGGLRAVVRTAPGAPASAWTPSLAQIAARGGRAGLHATGVPEAGDPLLAADAAMLVIEPVPGDVERLAFDLKRALSDARGRRPGMALLIAASPDTTSALRARGVAPYVDGFLPPSAPIETAAGLIAPAEEGTRVRRLPSTPADAARIAAAAARLQGWFPEGLVPVPDRVIACGPDRALPAFLNPQTLDLVAVSASCPAGAVVTSDVRGAAVDRMDVEGVSAFLVHGGRDDRFAAGVDVAARRTLTADEIVARQQAAAARQAAAVVTEIADGSLTLMFEAPGFVAPVTVTSETTIYTDGRRTDLRQRNIRVNGVRFDANGGVPRLPIIEPERAAAPPLAITLTDVYRYRLAGREAIRGHDAYVIAFTPRGRGESLFQGRAWIDASSFAMVRVAAAQTALKGPITASEQTDDFAPDASGRWLLARSDVRQTYEGASVRTPVHRLLVLERHVINAPDFAAKRAEAYASPDVMLRDTPEGFRYLKRERGSGQRAAGSGQPEAGSGQLEAGSVTPEGRVLAGRAERIRTFAFGVIVDPNISRPLPFAGLSYVDFNLFGTGTQFSGFFGGSYGQLAFSAPSLRGTRWQLAGRAFGIASSYNDRAFEQGREQYALDIRQRPAQAAVWLLRPLSARTALRLEYDWDYTRFAAAETTAPAFAIPRNQNAHGIRIGVDAQRSGWQASIWGSHAGRIGWRPWGLSAPAGPIPAHAAFQRYGASLLRSQAVSPRLTTRIEGAVMGGRHLDRFSRYAFGTFDNRLHGYPAALIRYDRGAVLRTAAALSAFGGLRIDGFADGALVHDPGFGPGLRHYAGLGAALEAPAPFRTLISLEWGYGFQGIDVDGRRGTHVVRLSGYKVF